MQRLYDSLTQRHLLQRPSDALSSFNDEVGERQRPLGLGNHL